MTSLGTVEQAFRVVEDDPHARVDQVVGDLLRSTRRHRQHADNDVLVARGVCSWKTRVREGR